MRLRRLLTDRATNALLLFVLALLAGTGILSLFANDASARAIFEVHRLGGAALLVLLIPKAGIIWRALRRKARGAKTPGRRSIILSLVLLLLTLVAIAAALGWSLARGPWDGVWGLPLIVVHWYLALGLLPLLIAHVALRWRRIGQVPRAVDFAGRRRLLALGVTAVMALAGWRGIAAGAIGSENRTSRRRFTGSREGDYGTPNGFFVTAFLNDDPAPLDPAIWQLRITGR